MTKGHHTQFFEAPQNKINLLHCHVVADEYNVYFMTTCNHKRLPIEGCKQQIKSTHDISLNVRLILRIEASSNNHPAKVPEAVFPTHNEERLIKVRMIFSQFLLLDFSGQPHKPRYGTNNSYCMTQQGLNSDHNSRFTVVIFCTYSKGLFSVRNLLYVLMLCEFL